MKWIGLTGGLGTGKSTVSNYLIKMGIPVIDADRIARQTLEKGSPGYAKFLEFFGSNLLDQGGEIDRLKLSHLVFSQPDKKKILEEIIHPLVQQEVYKQKNWLRDQGTELAFYDVPLLYENNLEGQFDAVVVVTCSEDLQRHRLKQRNPNWSDENISLRIKAQIPLCDKIKKADFVINNDADLKNLEKQVDDMIKVLKEWE